MNQVTLYIGYCPGSGKQYFGKTTKYHTQKDLQENYWGSGPSWIKHYHEWGDPIMSVYWSGKLEEVNKIALDFSHKNKIVSSTEWLNQKEETGLDGGYGWVHTEDAKRKIGKASTERIRTPEENIKTSKALIGHSVSEETRRKISEACKGRNHTEEAKKKISEASKGRRHSTKRKKETADFLNAQPDVACPHCGIVGRAPNIYVWHFDKCGKRPLIMCPHCGKTGKGGVMKRWHFDNCRFNNG